VLSTKNVKLNLRDGKVMTMNPHTDVICREVGLRDGLQIVDIFFPTDEKIRWMREEVAAGVGSIQACSFVPPNRLPQFKDAEQVARAAGEIEGLWVSVLVPNLMGAEIAASIGADEIGFITSVSESHNAANVRRTSDELLNEFRKIVEFRNSLPTEKRFKLTSGLSTAFGCSIEGAIDPASVMRLAEKYVSAGSEMLTVGDTVGYANPVQVKKLFGELIAEFGSDVDVLGHFHDTRGLGIANAFAAYEAGCVMFDASLAGLGGCPYAPTATGNIVMEDLVFMFESAGIRTGIDLEKLIPVRKIIEKNLPEEPLHGAFAEAGAPKGFVFVANKTEAAE